MTAETSVARNRQITAEGLVTEMTLGPLVNWLIGLVAPSGKEKG